MSDAFRMSLQAFADAGLANPASEAARLFEVLGLSVNGAGMTAVSGINLADVAAKRRAGEPMAYIMGQTRFMGLTFRCTPAALIPRTETELLANTAIQIAQQMLAAQDTVTIVDMGTGSGNIAVSLAVHLPQARVLACDVSETALELAGFHIKQHTVSDQVELFCGDMFAPLLNLGLEEKVDIVVCNPPYIPTGSLKKLAAEIINHEPTVALDAGAYGIDIFRKLIQGALLFLKPGGALAFEIGAGQERLASRLLQKKGGYETAVYSLLDDVIRVVSAHKKKK